MSDLDSIPGGQGPQPQSLEQFIAPELKEQKYGTLPQQLLTGAESAGSTATFGLSKGLERLAGVDPEDIRAREEENPGSAFTGSVAGLFAPTGVAGVLEKAGVSGAKLLGLGAENAGVLSRLAYHGVKTGVEGALLQGGNEVGKMLLSDPDQTAGTAAINVGLAGLLGGGLGAGLGGVGDLWEATIGKKLSGYLGTAADELQTPYKPDYLKAIDVDAALKNAPENAGQLKQDFDLLDIKPTPGAMTKEPFIREAEYNLSRSNSLSGIAQNKEYGEVFDKLRNEAEDSLKYRTEKTPAQVGKEIKEGVASKLEERLKPIEAEYESLKPELKKIKVSDDLKQEGIATILDHDFVKADEGMERLANKLSDRIKKIENVDDLKNVRSFISAELNKAYRAGGPETQIYQAAKDVLTDIRSKAINDAAGSNIVKPNVLERIKNADTAYVGYKKGLQDFGVESGIGNVGNARSMLDKFSKLSDESFAKKIFDTGDINQLNFFKQNFPEQFELARSFKMGEIYQDSISHAAGERGKFDIAKFLNQTRPGKLSPEARQILFGDTSRIDAVQRIFEGMPGNPNPSGTAYTHANMNLLNPEWYLKNLKDASIYLMLKAHPYLQQAAASSGGGEAGELGALMFAKNADKGADASAFNQMVKYIGQTIKGESTLSHATKAIFEAGKEVLPTRLVPNEKSRKKLDDKLKDLQSNNQDLFSIGEKVGYYMPEHGGTMSKTAVNAVNYLNSMRPDTSKKSPLDSEPVINKAQQADFNRALDIAEQPLIVLQDVKDGTIIPKDIVTMKTLYPGLYDRTAQKVFDHMTTHLSKDGSIPYKTRLGLSMFLGQPLDSTMTPQGIVGAQPIMPSAPKSQQMPGQQKSPGSLKNIGKIVKADLTPLQARQFSTQSKA